MKNIKKLLLLKIKLHFYALLIPTFFIIAIFIIKFFNKNESAYTHNKKICQKYIDMNIYGQIDCVFLDKKALLRYKLKNRTETFGFSAQLINIERKGYIRKNDLIIKKSGETKYYIYRNMNRDSLITIEFDCSDWDSLERNSYYQPKIKITKKY